MPIKDPPSVEVLPRIIASFACVRGQSREGRKGWG